MGATALSLGCIGADYLDCMRKVSKEALCGAFAANMFTGVTLTVAVVDGDVYAAPPLELFQQGRFNRVPVILGHTTKEWNFFTYPKTKAATAGQIECTFSKAFGGDKAKTVLQLYTPAAEPGVDNRDCFSDLVSDMVYHCVDRAIALAMANHSWHPWVYTWKHQPACPYVPGASHTAEMAYVFNNQHEVYKSYNWTCDLSQEELKLGALVSKMWADFAKNLKPDPAWMPFSAPQEMSLKLGLSTLSHYDLEGGYRRAQCDILAPIVDMPASLVLTSYYFAQCAGQSLREEVEAPAPSILV
eukprot:gnl/TRDRNA2_/TRDRNA2_158854_c1_seq2.p1 gnl/TRDRNA2_/TRDRNA2_158854_c1~~gnl/TRDRNA2_/TRDRNA2_158854_c1_seq2.p1  ORF type:complete len:333 (-),score=50.52 gnl/TRDRNA2_/TRDRNA2_158854_c1_seq2:22-921(-)